MVCDNVFYMRENPRIVICGNYGATNLGDEAILEGILTMVRRSIPSADITIMSSNPEETTSLHGEKSIFLVPAGVRSFFRGIFSGTIGETLDVMKRADLFILGGGGLFTDERPMAVLIWSLQVRMARFFKVPIFCFGQSVGPLRTFFGRSVTRKVFQSARMVSVRDPSSAILLQRSLGIDDVKELADPAFALASLGPIAEQQESYIVLSVRPWVRGKSSELYKILAQFIDWAWKSHQLKTILVPFQVANGSDIDVLNKIFDQVEVEDAAEIFAYTSDYRKIMELMSRSQAVVGMRLHSLIFSALAHTPFVGLSYSEKVRQFVKQVHMEEYLFEWENLELQLLKDAFEGMLKHRDEISVRIDDAVFDLRAKAMEHEELLRRRAE